MTNKDTYAVVLAAGKGTRMKSKLYKVLHPVCDKPMVSHVIDAVQTVQPQDVLVVVGHGAQNVQAQLGDAYTYVLQEQQLGTGHAVMVTREQLQERKGTTLVMYGDTPLVRPETLQAFVDAHQHAQAAMTVLTTRVSDPSGYGRIVRDGQEHIRRIVEEKDASVAEKKITEINTGIYCFDNERLMEALGQLTNDNVQGEYYLTDCLHILSAEGHVVNGYETSDADETMGINDRVALAQAEKVMQRRVNEYHMVQGVTIKDPDATYIAADVHIGQDTVIHPGSILRPGTRIGEECEIGPYTELDGAQIGDRTVIWQSKMVQGFVGSDSTIGPFAYLRPGARIGNKCKIGDFVEIKNAVIGDEAKVPHLSYIGDAHIGQRVNMGCGSVTVNYDGQNKHQTVVEADSFVGCNANLVAPVTIGAQSYVAAGSTITEDVPPQGLAIARERQTNKEQYVQHWKQKQNKKSD